MYGSVSVVGGNRDDKGGRDRPIQRGEGGHHRGGARAASWRLAVQLADGTAGGRRQHPVLAAIAASVTQAFKSAGLAGAFSLRAYLAATRRTLTCRTLTCQTLTCQTWTCRIWTYPIWMRP